MTEALSASPHVRPWTQAAMGAAAVLPDGPMRSLYLGLGLKLIHGWCVHASARVCAQKNAGAMGMGAWA